tara:strand:+ start:1092 stop:2087 length:996 start_codon:yes stop_codon:yes gene_type:complete
MQNKYLFELGGENTELGKYEALNLLSSNNYEPILNDDFGKIIHLSTKRVIEKGIIFRLAMTKRISKVILHSKKNNILDIIKKIDEIDIGNNTFRIRQMTKSKLNEREIAILLGEKINDKNRINLEKPQVTILFYKCNEFFITLNYHDEITAYKKCLKHHISLRPYFSPISIHPRIARAMINLSNCNENDILLDPFCGTGGILIEGADMKLKVVGIDLKEKMIEYSKGNLNHYGLNGTVIKADFEKLKEMKFESIVCDPPYGIASTTGGEKISSMMERFIRIIDNKMIKGQRLVIALNDTKLLKKEKLKIIHHFKWYIHKSLTRNILVLEKN